MTPRSRKLFITAAALLCVAIGLRFGVAARFGELPADYRLQTKYVLDGTFRESPDEPGRVVPQTAVRVDQALLTSGGACIVQSDTSWFTVDGALTYESRGLYGVDRHSRANVPELGDTSRHGQFLFPQHVRRASFAFWDAFYIGARRASFIREDTIDGLPVLVFDIVGDGIDDTAAYEFLPSIPERYRARTSGHTTVWVEPVTGMVVDLDDTGESSFVEPDDQTRVGSIACWRSRFAPRERARLLAEARQERTELLAVERWLPLTALAGAAGTAVLGILPLRRRRAFVGSRP